MLCGKEILMGYMFREIWVGGYCNLWKRWFIGDFDWIWGGSVRKGWFYDFLEGRWYEIFGSKCDFGNEGLNWG